MGKELSVITTVKDFFERVTCTQAEARARARATEAAMRFAGQPNQEPGATFTSDSKSQFDLNRLKPESVFRVRYEGKSIRRTDHRWFVIGDRKNDKTLAYEIVFGADDDDNLTHVQLMLTPGFFVTQIEPHEFVFPVCEAHYALGGEKQDGTFLVSRIDVMRQIDKRSEGKSEEILRPSRVALGVMVGEGGILAPIPVEGWV